MVRFSQVSLLPSAGNLQGNLSKGKMDSLMQPKPHHSTVITDEDFLRSKGLDAKQCFMLVRAFPSAFPSTGKLWRNPLTVEGKRVLFLKFETPQAQRSLGCVAPPH